MTTNPYMANIRFSHNFLIVYNKLLNLTISYSKTVDKDGINPNSFLTNKSSQPSYFNKSAGTYNNMFSANS